MKKSDDRYTNKGDDYDEESSLGFDSDSSDTFQNKDEKQDRVPKLNLQGTSASYENISNGKSKNSTRKKTEIVGNNNKKNPSKIRRRKKKTGKNIKGLPVLSKRNRSSETDSELEWAEDTEWSEKSGSEFDEYVDETMPASKAQENDTKINFKRGTENNQDVDDGTKMNVFKKQDEKGMKTYDQIHNADLSDEGKINTGVLKPVIKKIDGAQEMSENDVDIQFKEKQNKSNHFELTPKEVKRGNSKVTEKDKYSNSVRQNGNKTPTDPKAKEIDKSKEKTSMQYKTDTVIGPMAAKSRNIGGKTQISPSEHEKKLSNELHKGNAELQGPLSSEIRHSKDTFPSNERRKTYDTLYYESEPVHNTVTYNVKIKYTKNDQNVRLENNLNDDGSKAVDKTIVTHADGKKNVDIKNNDEHNNSSAVHPNFENLLNREKTRM
uniref:Eukaryotic translation initiation factor 4B-like n=1 Tax=Crassostrea virginica TaxID=6565 RepID=A0A8B8D5S7_CRAVI|nr:eukaryotic translation initiation factor 4B-like [Crassostrea virginica]